MVNLQVKIKVFSAKPGILREVVYPSTVDQKINFKEEVDVPVSPNYVFMAPINPEPPSSIFTLTVVGTVPLYS